MFLFMAGKWVEAVAKIIGLGLTILVLLLIWAAVGKRLVTALNGGEPMNYEMRK
jgi:hypothetical protein